MPRILTPQAHREVLAHGAANGLKPRPALNRMKHLRAELIHLTRIQGRIGGDGLVNLPEGNAHSLLLGDCHPSLFDQGRECFGCFSVVAGLQAGSDSRDRFLDLWLGALEGLLKRLSGIGVVLLVAAFCQKRQAQQQGCAD